MITIALITYHRQRSMKNGNQPVATSSSLRRLQPRGSTDSPVGTGWTGLRACTINPKTGHHQPSSEPPVQSGPKVLEWWEFPPIIRDGKKRPQNSLNTAGAHVSKANLPAIRRYFPTDKRIKFVRKRSVKLATSFFFHEDPQPKD